MKPFWTMFFSTFFNKMFMFDFKQSCHISTDVETLGTATQDKTRRWLQMESESETVKCCVSIRLKFTTVFVQQPRSQAIMRSQSICLNILFDRNLIKMVKINRFFTTVNYFQHDTSWEPSGESIHFFWKHVSWHLSTKDGVHSASQRKKQRFTLRIGHPPAILSMVCNRNCSCPIQQYG